VFRDEGVSGGVPFDEREGGRKAREFFLRGACTLKKGQKRGAPAHLIAAKLDRLGRETRDILGLVPEYQSAGISIHTADEGGRLENLAENENAEFLLTVRAAAAAMEKRKISTRTRAVLAHKRKQGLRTGRVPYGWKLAADGKHLEECEVEQPAYREIERAHLESKRIRDERENVEALLAEERERLRSNYSRAHFALTLRSLGIAEGQPLPSWYVDLEIDENSLDLGAVGAQELESDLLEYFLVPMPGESAEEQERRFELVRAEIRAAVARAEEIEAEIGARVRTLTQRRAELVAVKKYYGATALVARLNSNPALYPKRTGALWVEQDIQAMRARLERIA
jgi:DNA invertase Pin-like site-specific DNA recombinase